VKLDPTDALTTTESRKLLDPLIKPLPSFDEMIMGRRVLAAPSEEPSAFVIGSQINDERHECQPQGCPENRVKHSAIGH
jgi:hypothetical protein